MMGEKLHCKACGWQQDDFWEPYGVGYHPFKKDTVIDWIEDIEDAIKGNKTVELDLRWAEDAGLSYNISNGVALVPILEYVAYQLETKAKNIKNMHWLTKEEFTNDPEKICPKCGYKL